jgi:hypothetical protein
MSRWLTDPAPRSSSLASIRPSPVQVTRPLPPRPYSGLDYRTLKEIRQTWDDGQESLHKSAACTVNAQGSRPLGLTFKVSSPGWDCRLRQPEFLPAREDASPRGFGPYRRIEASPKGLRAKPVTRWLSCGAATRAGNRLPLGGERGRWDVPVNGRVTAACGNPRDCTSCQRAQPDDDRPERRQEGKQARQRAQGG